MSPALWVRYEHAGREGFGLLDGERIRVHHGDLFAAPQDSGEELALQAVRLLAPVRPSKVLALWNNFGQLAAKLGLERPAEPLYFIKSPNSYLNPGARRSTAGSPTKASWRSSSAVAARACRQATPWPTSSATPAPTTSPSSS
jgi:2-keto-4-pentenoate hydratase/2-oxohepta-3-ene-1,7-dioic acid hydratase in catechol pathway